MEPGERRRRMRAMRTQLHRSTIFDWLEAILARCAELMDGGGAPLDRERRRQIVTEAPNNGESGTSTRPPDTAPWGEARS
jgi:hypothetical protein